MLEDSPCCGRAPRSCVRVRENVCVPGSCRSCPSPLLLPLLLLLLPLFLASPSPTTSHKASTARKGGSRAAKPQGKAVAEQWNRKEGQARGRAPSTTWRAPPPSWSTSTCPCCASPPACPCPADDRAALSSRNGRAAGRQRNTHAGGGGGGGGRTRFIFSKSACSILGAPSLNRGSLPVTAVAAAAPRYQCWCKVMAGSGRNSVRQRDGPAEILRAIGHVETRRKAEGD